MSHPEQQEKENKAASLMGKRGVERARAPHIAPPLPDVSRARGPDVIGADRDHSMWMASTGLASAARTAWNPTVRRAINTARTAAAGNIHQPMETR